MEALRLRPHVSLSARPLLAAQGGEYRGDEARHFLPLYAEVCLLQGFQAVGNLLQIPESGRKKRQRFTKKQTELISDILLPDRAAGTAQWERNR